MSSDSLSTSPSHPPPDLLLLLCSLLWLVPLLFTQLAKLKTVGVILYSLILPCSPPPHIPSAAKSRRLGLLHNCFESVFSPPSLAESLTPGQGIQGPSPWPSPACHPQLLPLLQPQICSSKFSGFLVVSNSLPSTPWYVWKCAGHCISDHDDWGATTPTRGWG